MMLCNVYFTALHPKAHQIVCLHLKPVLEVNLTFDLIRGKKDSFVLPRYAFKSDHFLDKMLSQNTYF